LDVAATFIGLSLPLPTINEARGEKPTLTSEQEARVLAYYAADKALYDSLTAGEGAVVPPASEPQPQPAPQALLPVPQQISARQIRLWLVQHGVSLAIVETAIDAIPDATTRESVRVEWEYAPHVERTHAWLVSIAAALGLTETQVDQAFREASQL